MKYLRGQTITAVILWSAGMAFTMGLAAVSFANSQIGKVADAQTITVQRISVVETKSDQYSKDIESINKKLDRLLEAQGLKIK